MTKSLILAFTAFLATGAICSNAQSPSLTRKIAHRWIDALNAHDTLGLAELYADSAILLSPNWEGSKIGQGAVKEVYRRYFTSTPNLSYQLTHIIATDSFLVIEYISSGALSNPESTAPAYMKFKKYSLQNCTRLDILDGKIRQQVNYFDQVAFLRQVGFFEQHDSR